MKVAGFFYGILNTNGTAMIIANSNNTTTTNNRSKVLLSDKALNEVRTAPIRFGEIFSANIFAFVVIAVVRRRRFLCMEPPNPPIVKEYFNQRRVRFITSLHLVVEISDLYVLSIPSGSVFNHEDYAACATGLRNCL